MSDAFTCNGRISMDPIAYAQMGGHSAAPMANVRVLQTYTSGMCMLQVMAILGVSFSIWWFMLASDSAKATLEEFAAPVVGAFASACGWLLDSARALKERIQGAPISPFCKGATQNPMQELCRALGTNRGCCCSFMCCMCRRHAQDR